MKKLISFLLMILCVLALVVFHEPVMKQISHFTAVQDLANHIAGVSSADTNVAEAGSLCYAYSTLSSDKQLIYNQMADCLLDFKKEVTISTRDEATARQVYECLMSDHPEIFWSSSYECTAYNVSGLGTQLIFRPVYAMEMEQIRQYQEQIDTVVSEWLEPIAQEQDEYLIIKYLYEYLIQHTDYDMQAENNQNICSVFLEGRSVCMGYAKAMQYLLQKKGIQAALVSGEANKQLHAWNLVKLNGDYYYVDATWGDPEFTKNSETEDYIDYGFLGITTEELLETHSLGNTFELPECTADACNYFVREGLYLEKFDEEQVLDIVQSHWEENSVISLKCQDPTVYQQLYQYLIEDGRIRKLIRGNKINYIENEKRNILTLFKPS